MSAAESEVQDDLRATLEAAFKGEPENVEAEPIETPEAEAAKPERARDEKGRFAAKDGSAADSGGEGAATDGESVPGSELASAAVGDSKAGSEAPAEPALAPPNGWSAEAKAKWHELPAEVQAAAVKREEDIAKFTSKSDEERQFGRDMYRTVSPYMALIQAEGGTPVAAVQSLLNTAYILRTGHPEQKRRLLLQTAQQFGVDLTPSEAEANVPPEYQALQQRINQLEGLLTNQQQVQHTQLQTEVQSEIGAFAADPSHPHFQEVKAHMAALLKEGAASDLQDAYDQACWARKDIRATLLAQQRAEEEQKRKAEAKARAEEAKRKSVSITGGPGNTAGKSAPESRSLRDELEAQFAASNGAV